MEVKLTLMKGVAESGDELAPKPSARCASKTIFFL